MARNGKIARLPHDLRMEVNRRLLDGEKSRTILAWLNAEPDAIRIWSREFEGVPASPQNLSEWRLGGFKEWKDRQDRADALETLATYATDLAEKGMGLSGGAAAIAGGRILEALEAVALAGDDDESDPADQLAKLVNAAVSLRSVELQAHRLELDKRKQHTREQAHALDREKFESQTAEKFIEWARSKEAGAILDSGKPRHEMLDSLRTLMFGERPD